MTGVNRRRGTADGTRPGRRDVVVVGASAGGVEALMALVAALPADFAGTVLVVLHMPATGTSVLPDILDRAGPLPARAARAGDPLEPGCVLVAPPDQHLVLYDDAVTLSHGPKENGHRPAVDVLFRSAASALGPRVSAVVLSGALDDGAAGAVAVRLRGGQVLVQDPAEALVPSMPRATAASCPDAEVLEIKAIADRLVETVQTTVPARGPSSELMRKEVAVARGDAEALTDPDRPGEPSGWSCPDCHGSLFQIEEGGLVRFRCRVGHAWSAGGLTERRDEELESALWVALRSLEEKASLTKELSTRAAEGGHRLTAEQFGRTAEEADASALLLRDLIARLGS